MPSSLTESTPVARSLRNVLRLMTEYGVFKLGEYTLKSGQRSPIYIDLRECFGHMDLLEALCGALDRIVGEVEKEKKYTGIVGVPYAALPYATVLSTYTKQPLLIIRKEAKSYGTKKLIEGTYAPGQRVVVIEDVVTTGASLKEVIATLRNEGLIVEDVFCLLDRDQGGPASLEEMGVTLHSLLNMEKVLSFLSSVGRLSDAQWEDIVKSLSLPYDSIKRIEVQWEKEPEPADNGSHASGDENKENGHGKSRRLSSVRLSLAARERLASNPLSKKIFGLMNKKESNLCVAIDYTDTEKILELASKAGPYVVAIKIHADTIENYSEEFTTKLRQLANDYEFVLFEDRKFSDTGATMALQAKKDAAKWADLVTVYAVPGEASIKSAFAPLIASADYALKGILLIGQLSTEGSLLTEEYTKGARKIGEDNGDFVTGFICQDRMVDAPGFLHWTPGVNLDVSTDGKGQQWRTIQKAIVEQENDIVIVGRAICDKPSPVPELKRYREAAWEALCSTLPK